MIPFRGYSGFLQYISSNRRRCGVKVFKLCSISGYTKFDKLIAGKKSDVRNSGLSVTSQTTLEIMELLLLKGKTLYRTFIPVCNWLHADKNRVVGGLQINRNYNPKSITEAKLRRGDMRARRPGVYNNW